MAKYPVSFRFDFIVGLFVADNQVQSLREYQRADPHREKNNDRRALFSSGRKQPDPCDC